MISTAPQEYPPTPPDPCVPSPCGSYAQCRNVNGVPACSCVDNYVGQPPNCRPECSINSECPTDKACINHKCVDPCPGSCGALAICSIVNHVPVCACSQGYTGDPFTQCNLQPPISKPYSFFCSIFFSFQVSSRPNHIEQFQHSTRT